MGHRREPRRLFACLVGLVSAAAAAAQAAPFDVELLVFTRRVYGAVPGRAIVNDRPACVSQAVPPPPADPAQQMPFSLPETQRRLASEAATLSRRGSGLQVLLHRAWRQEVGPQPGGPWIRLAAAGLDGCLRVGGEPVPQAEWDIAYQRAPGEEYRLEGSRRLLPGDLHYVDHPAFGVLVRVDPVVSEAPAAAAESPPGPATPTGAEPPGAPGSIPPPPKKPFRW